MTASPTFSVKDASGNVLGGVSVTVAVTAGGGSLANAPTTTASGSPTSVGAWTLGKVAGLNTVTVTVGSLPPLLISVNGVAGPPAAIVITGGNAQAAFAGTTLPTPLSAQVRDQFGNGVAGSSVTFIITGGGGSISPSTFTTDATGTAGGAIWQLGRSAIPQSLIAFIPGFTVPATATVSTAFNVTVRFFGPPPPPEASAGFLAAAARISASIVGDIGDIDIPTLTAGAGINISNCGPTGVIVNEIVHDVLIYATVVSIDGPGKILASAGPCIIRSASRLTIIGVMQFDADDIAGLISTGRLNDVILHEMMHVVGFGTIWTDIKRPGGVLLTGGGTDNPRFIGPLATAACGVIGGSVTACGGGVAVEGLPAGPGTADSHWRESIFHAELMTGFVEAPGISTPLSSMTIQSLADEGYTVNTGAADPYSVPAISASRQLRASIATDGAQTWEVVMKPVFEVSGGRIQRVSVQ
jgi:Leishmanolysin